MPIKYNSEISIHDYYDLINDAGWRKLSESQVKKSLQNSAYTTVAHAEGKAVGIARLISDHSCHGLLHDVIVLKEFRGKGIGRKLVENVLNYIKNTLNPGEMFIIELLPSAGKRDFYLRCGFKYKPEKMDGMYLWIEK